MNAREKDRERLSKERKTKEKKSKIKDKEARTSQQTLPYKRMLGNNLVEVRTGIYSKTYQFSDINYQISNEEDQTDIFLRYGDILNCLDTAVEMQVSIINTNVNKKDFNEKVLIKEKNDELDIYRQEYNAMIQDKLEEGRNDLRSEKYITLTTEAKTEDEAKYRFNNLYSEMQSNFKKLGSNLREVTNPEKITLMKNIFRGQATVIPKLSMQDYEKGNERQYIAPDYFEFKKDYFMYNDKYAKAIFIRDLPSFLNDKLISELTDLGLEQNISINIQAVEPGKAMKIVRHQITGMEGDKIEHQKRAIRSGYSPDIISHHLKHSLEEAEELLDDLTRKNQKMFLVNICILHTANSFTQLNTDTETIRSIARKYLCNVGVLYFQQEDGLKSTIPIGNCTLQIRRTLTTESTAIFMPFATQEMIQDQGMYYGLNAVSKNLIMFNRKSMKNQNGFILGTPGCFIGSTKLKLANGEEKSFEQLIEMKGEEIFIRSYDLKNKCEIITQAREPRETKKVKNLIKITLSNGEEITCTTDHRFLTKEGKYVAAEELIMNQDLMPKHSVIDKTFINLQEEVSVYDITVDEYENFQLASGVYVHNSGKSFAAKREMVNVLLNTEDDVIIIDPEREYTYLVESFGGEIINISASSQNYINPLDMSEKYSDKEDPIVLKSEFILSLCENVLGGKQGLSRTEITIIDRCLRHVYREYIKDFDREKIPTLKDFYNELKNQKEAEAKEVALALEIYVEGSLGIFANKTNINLNNRLKCFDIKDLGKQLSTMGLLIVLDNVWNSITENRSKGKNTWIYIDEIYLLFKNEYSANFLFELYKRARKWGGIPTGITQNVEDLLESDLARKMLSNSDFIQMLSQAPSDRNELAKLLNISETQLSFVTNADEGQGLLFCGDSIIPFQDHFPKNTQLYKMMTTKLKEM